MTDLYLLCRCFPDRMCTSPADATHCHVGLKWKNLPMTVQEIPMKTEHATCSFWAFDAKDDWHLIRLTAGETYSSPRHRRTPPIPHRRPTQESIRKISRNSRIALVSVR
jgi:hypothetical protein